jgi:hypothetical protein
MREWMFVCAIAVLLGCGSEETTVRPVAVDEPAEAEHEHTEATDEGPQPSAILPDGSRQFGGALTDRAPTALSAISASPTTFDGQTVRTEGTIERVCQRMGCWMELRADGTEPVRVPMAGHSFFLPRDVAGHAATIEGNVHLTPLTPERRAHLESEGALATAGDLSIEATSVVVR